MNAFLVWEERIRNIINHNEIQWSTQKLHWLIRENKLSNNSLKKKLKIRNKKKQKTKTKLPPFTVNSTAKSNHKQTGSPKTRSCPVVRTKYKYLKDNWSGRTTIFKLFY